MFPLDTPAGLPARLRQSFDGPLWAPRQPTPHRSRVLRSHSPEVGFGDGVVGMPACAALPWQLHLLLVASLQPCGLGEVHVVRVPSLFWASGPD